MLEHEPELDTGRHWRLTSLLEDVKAARRVLDLADRVTIDPQDATDDMIDAGEYTAAIRGIDAVESIASAVEASKARLIAEAHARSDAELTDPDRTPGEQTEHPDGQVVSALSRTQITGLDLATVLHVSPGAAKARVTDALRLVRDLRGTGHHRHLR